MHENRSASSRCRNANRTARSASPNVPYGLWIDMDRLLVN
jgi:hypothetical protein